MRITIGAFGMHALAGAHLAVLDKAVALLGVGDLELGLCGGSSSHCIVCMCAW